MPQTPENLSKIIREMAERQARIRGKTIDEAALGRVSRIPSEYGVQETISVDLYKLEEMISDVIDLAATTTGSTISIPRIEDALKKVHCHYLWFC